MAVTFTKASGEKQITYDLHHMYSFLFSLSSRRSQNETLKFGFGILPYQDSERWIFVPDRNNTDYNKVDERASIMMIINLICVDFVWKLFKVQWLK